MLWTLFIVMFLISSSAPSILGGNVSSGIGFTTSTISAIFWVFSITTSLQASSPKYSNSFIISLVVLKYKGGWLSASPYPWPAIIILLNTSSLGSKKWQSHVATTGLSISFPKSYIFLFNSLSSSSSFTFPFLIRNSLFCIGWISR